MKRYHRWVPGPLRARVPERLLVRYRAFTPVPVERSMEDVRGLLEHVPSLGEFQIEGVGAGVTWTRSTRVFGCIPRDTEERIQLYLKGGHPPAVELLCAPQGLHDAHATGFAGVLAFTAATGLTVGAPAAVATLLGGSLLAVTAREHALLALRRHLAALAEELGSGLWPGAPAELDWIEASAPD